MATRALLSALPCWTTRCRDAAQVYAQRVILDLKDSDSLTAADFGITDASIAVTAVYTDGAELTFHIGDLLPEETPAYYMMIAGDTRVFATDQEAHDVFSRSRMALHAVPDPAIKGDLIDAIAFAGRYSLPHRAPGGGRMVPDRAL